VKGKEIEVLGVYHPCARPEPFSRVDAHRALHWLRTGALPSDTVRSLFSKLGIMAHLHYGTTPEEPVVEFAHGPEAVKGYTPPAPPKPVPAPEPEPAAEPETAEESAVAGEVSAEGSGDIAS
jgi:ribosomal protein S16